MASPLHNPYAVPGSDASTCQWLRGNLHTHTTRSDGSAEPQAVIDDFVGRGYDFLCLSDHDIWTTPDDLAALDAKGLVLIPGNEISAHGPHILHVDARSFVPPTLPRQTVFDAIRDQGGMAIVNHPNWGADYQHCSLAQIIEWHGYQGIEIYNGVISRLAGSPYALDRWDSLLTRGRRIWGFANDDYHRPDTDAELGWNVALCAERSVSAIMDALAAGRFYASTGVAIVAIEVEGDRIRIETDKAQRVIASIQDGVRVATVDGPAIEITVPEKARYVRFECWGPGETFAWTQPFFVEKGEG